MNYVCFNGRLFPSNEPIITADNKGFKYGDGVFETIKVIKGSMPLEQYHFERLHFSLNLLKIEIGESLQRSVLSDQIMTLCNQNNCSESARVRLAVFRNNEQKGEYVIEASPLDQDIYAWLSKGIVIDLYPYARKSIDAFSNLKTANFLPYVMAGLYAQEKGIEDCIVLNAHNNLCDTSKANIFLIKNREIFTPALHQGCVSGVMRRFLIEELKARQFTVFQKELTEQDLFDADEVFLTNALFGLRWVRSYKGKEYSNEMTYSIHQMINTHQSSTLGGET
jgi:branched-chain amino acid aminotransferase